MVVQIMSLIGRRAVDLEKRKFFMGRRSPGNGEDVHSGEDIPEAEFSDYRREEIEGGWSEQVV